MSKRCDSGSIIGIGSIKERRLQNELNCHPGLHVGECVPFYFCPRSVMLYLIYRGNHPDLTYRGGQGPIVHLECDFQAALHWAEKNEMRWAFTLTNAGSSYFEDRCDTSQLNEIDWDAVRAVDWKKSIVKERKQAEFLMEEQFPWSLVERIGVHSRGIAQRTLALLDGITHRPSVATKPEWYYN